MKKYLHISSDTPGYLHFDDDKIFVGNKKVHLLVDGNILTEFKPSNTNLQSITLNIPQQNNSVICTIPYHNNHYDININTMQLPKTQFTPNYHHTFGKIDIEVLDSGATSVVNVYLQHSLQVSINTPLLENVNTYTNSFVIIEATTHGKPYAIVIDENFQVIVNSTCVEYEKDDNKIKLLIDLHDCIGHGKVYEFDVVNNTYSQYLVYLYDTPLSPTSDLLVPLAMLQCVQAGNTKLATSYFADNVDVDKIRGYFGNVQSAHYNVYIKDVINYTVIGDTIKYYNFVVNNGKILDIEQC